MKVNDIKAELQARGRSGEGKKEELQKELLTMLGGTTRLPALLHNSENRDVSVQELNIERYEVLYFEALHCSMNHIKNLVTLSKLFSVFPKSKIPQDVRKKINLGGNIPLNMLS